MGVRFSEQSLPVLELLMAFMKNARFSQANEEQSQLLKLVLILNYWTCYLSKLEKIYQGLLVLIIVLNLISFEKEIEINTDH